ncbi:MAG: hemerythrin domain-containing protein [Aquificaceae bacterium]|nr:hemerythrin domain-containing protein [Aquificaceae bacterium]
MHSIRDYLTEEHRRGDSLYAKLEELVRSERWKEAEEVFKAFEEDVLTHFKKEEDILFPEFERTTGITMGPTQVMRVEHAQARELLERMKSALEGRDKKNFLAVADTLMILLQQHNMKEEQILYPMCDQYLDSLELVNRMDSL